MNIYKIFLENSKSQKSHLKLIISLYEKANIHFQQCEQQLQIENMRNMKQVSEFFLISL